MAAAPSTENTRLRLTDDWNSSGNSPRGIFPHAGQLYDAAAPAMSIPRRPACLAAEVFEDFMTVFSWHLGQVCSKAGLLSV